MSMFSKLFKKAMDSKLTGKLVGGSYMAPLVAGADLVSKKPFFKGAAQGQRALLGTGAAIAGGMFAAPMLAGGGSTAAGLGGTSSGLFGTTGAAGGGGLAGVTPMVAPTSAQLAAGTAGTAGTAGAGSGASSQLLSQLLSSGMSSGQSQQPQRKEFEYLPMYRSRYNQI